MERVSDIVFSLQRITIFYLSTQIIRNHQLLIRESIVSKEYFDIIPLPDLIREQVATVTIEMLGKSHNWKDYMENKLHEFLLAELMDSIQWSIDGFVNTKETLRVWYYKKQPEASWMVFCLLSEYCVEDALYDYYTQKMRYHIPIPSEKDNKLAIYWWIRYNSSAKKFKPDCDYDGLLLSKRALLDLNYHATKYLWGREDQVKIIQVIMNCDEKQLLELPEDLFRGCEDVKCFQLMWDIVLSQKERCTKDFINTIFFIMLKTALHNHGVFSLLSLLEMHIWIKIVEEYCIHFKDSHFTETSAFSNDIQILLLSFFFQGYLMRGPYFEILRQLLTKFIKTHYKILHEKSVSQTYYNLCQCHSELSFVEDMLVNYYNSDPTATFFNDIRQKFINDNDTSSTFYKNRVISLKIDKAMKTLLINEIPVRELSKFERLCQLLQEARRQYGEQDQEQPEQLEQL